MKKIFHFALLLFCFTLLLSCKDDEIATQDQLSGKWNLVSIQSDFKTTVGNSSEKYDFIGKGGYLELKKDQNDINAIESNLVMSNRLDGEFLQKSSPYTLWYSKFVNSLYIDVYDMYYDKKVPVTFEIKSMKNGTLILVVTKNSFGEILKEYDKLDGSTTNSDFFTMVTAAEITLTLTK